MTDPHAQAFFQEIDRRISCPDYPQVARERLVKIKPALRIFYETEPDEFSKLLHELLPEFFPGWQPDWKAAVYE